jgi:hypothetical protein
MATRTSLELEDDLDGGPADRTLQFSLDGSDYEIDLNTGNASAFRHQLAVFLNHARAVDPRRSFRPGRTASSRQRSRQIRAWAKEQGIPVSDRGRIPANVTERYYAATGQLLTAPFRLGHGSAAGARRERRPLMAVGLRRPAPTRCAALPRERAGRCRI